MLEITELKLQGAFKVKMSPIGDERGAFSRVFCQKVFKEKTGRDLQFVQMNFSRSNDKGTIRGLHYQKPPFAEDKLVRCVKGAIFDVVVDLRKESSTFLQWEGLELSEDNHTMFFIPKGFAHGFQTLTGNVEISYCHTEYYHPEAEQGILYSDPKVSVDWPLPSTVMSERDQAFKPIEDNFGGLEL